jgi:hypothetical protein
MKQRFYVQPHGLGCGSFASQQIRRQPTLHCFSASLMVILLWLIATPVHACSDPGCDEWCNEPLSVYFLQPSNDSRANLALILEDIQVLRFKVEDIPFHYHAFADNIAQPSPDTQENKDSIEFAELALRLGVRQVEPADIALPDVK